MPREAADGGGEGTEPWIGTDVGSLLVARLLGLYRAILRALRERGVTRTDNAPTGDYAEYLTAAAYGGQLSDPSQRGWDVRAGDGRRLQVKGRVNRRQLGVIRSFDFDALIVVLFDNDYRIEHAVELPPETAKAYASWREHVNGFVLNVTRELLGGPGRGGRNGHLPCGFNRLNHSDVFGVAEP